MFRFIWKFLPVEGRYFNVMSYPPTGACFNTCACLGNNDDNMVRLIDETGTSLGLMSKEDAENIAKDKQRSLLQVASAGAKRENNVFKLIEGNLNIQKAVKKRIKSKELTMKSQIEEQDLTIKAKKLQQFLDSDYQVTLKISKPTRSKVLPRKAYENLISKLNCRVRLPGAPKESEHYFRCVVTKDKKS